MKSRLWDIALFVLASPVLADLESRLGQVQTNMSEPIHLVSPINGMVHLVNHQTGEFVPE